MAKGVNVGEKDELREILSPEVISERVKELGRQITRDYQGGELVIVGILKGAFIFMADLVRAIDLPMEVDFIRLTSYGSADTSSGEVRITKDIEINVSGKDVVVVEDIVDTGLTLKYLRDVLKLHNTRSVKICCLIDKKERRAVDVEVDYVGFDVPRGFLVGYGLDYNERYRNLPGVFHLNPGYSPEGYAPSQR